MIIKEGMVLILLLFFTSFDIRSGDSFQQISVKPIQQGELKILSWNIYMLPHCSLINGNTRRAKAIAENLSGSEYDIIVFQEAFDYRARKIIRNILNKKYPYM